MSIFDTHAHYGDDRFEEDRESLLLSMKEHGIGNIVEVGAGIQSTKDAIELSEKYDFIYAAVGIHPEEAGDIDESHMQWIKELAAKEKVVAIGEIGLDYHYDEPERDIQKKWFQRQLEISKEVDLPIIIHSRDAAKDTLDLIKEYNPCETGGVIHCFSYGIDMAKIYLNMGFYLGIGGVVTFKNSKKLKEVVEYMPLDRIVLETDCPYLTPEPNRGKRNSSIYLPYVVKSIAEIKNISEDEIIRVTEDNARKLYRITERNG